MKLTLIRTARETGKETFSTWPSDTLMEKMKTENKAGHISALRSLIPHITGSNGHYPCIDKLPRICPQQRGGKIPENLQRTGTD